VQKDNNESFKLSIFKGKEAKLNRAIFQVLSNKSPLTRYDILKNVTSLRGFRHKKYAVIDSRIKALQKQDRLKIVGQRKTKQGGETDLYALCERTKLEIVLDSIGIEKWLSQLDEKSASFILKIINSCK
jgi:hypothetical protein